MGRIRVTQVLEATVGGTGKHLRDLVTHLDAGRFDVSVVCSLGRDPGYAATIERMRAAGARVEVISMTREIAPGEDRSAFAELRRLLRELQPEIVHAHSSKAGFLARVTARSLGISATVYTPHCFAFQMESSGLRTAVYRGIERLAGRWTKRLIAVSEQERDLAVRERICRADRVVLLPNGLDLAEMDGQLTREQARETLGIAPEQFVVGAVGRLSVQKAPQDFVRAAEELGKRRVDARFIWIGGGELEQSMRELAAPMERGRLTLTGERGDAVRLYQAFDVFVMSSRWEGCPYAALEASGSGLPLVSTAVGGLRDLVVEGQTGLLVPPGRPDELAAAVIKLYGDPDLRREMGEKGKARVREQFDLRDQIRATERLYEEVAAG